MWLLPSGITCNNELFEPLLIKYLVLVLNVYFVNKIKGYYSIPFINKDKLPKFFNQPILQ
jgi:hypothetical protein